jgi:hypothetical protein
LDRFSPWGFDAGRRIEPRWALMRTSLTKILLL